MTDAVDLYSGKRVLKLRHFIRPPSAPALATLVAYAEKNSPAGEGWIELESHHAKHDALVAALGFTCVQLDLELQVERSGLRSVSDTVRPATTDDLQQIRELAHRCLPEILCYPPGLDRQIVVEHSRRCHPTLTANLNLSDQTLEVMVAHNQEGTLTGYLVLVVDEESALINDIAVAQEFRGGPTARQLLAAALARLRRLEISLLEATIAADNPRSWKPARRLGFEIVSKRWLKRIDSGS